MKSNKKKSVKHSGKPIEKAKKVNPPAEAETLKGWTAIGAFLGLPAATAQRWARDGMPVRKDGRFTTANRSELQAWLGRESHMGAPAHVATSSTDLAAALKESIASRKNHST